MSKSAIQLSLLLALALGQQVLAQDAFEAKLKFSDRLEALDPRLSVGSTFDKQFITNVLGGETNVLDPRNKWCQIPPWFAGSWSKTVTTTTYRRNEATGELDTSAQTYPSKGGEEWGHMRDAEGNVWHVYGNNFWRVSKQDAYDTYTFRCELEPVYVTQKAVIVRGKSFVFKVDRANKISSVSTSQSLSHFRPVRDGIIRARKMYRAFDASGRPTWSTSELEVHNRSKPFMEFRPDNALDVKLKNHLDNFLRTL